MHSLEKHLESLIHLLQELRVHMVQVTDLSPALASLSSLVDAAVAELQADSHNEAALESAMNQIAAMQAKLATVATPPATAPATTPDQTPAPAATPVSGS